MANDLLKLAAQIGWAAGLFEGEGCFTPFKSKHLPRKSDGGVSYIVYPHAQITMCDLDVLQRFHKIVGVGKLNGPHSPKRRDGNTRKPTYHWYAFYQEALKVTQLLAPFMGERRQAQILTALNSCGKFDTRKDTI